MPPEKNYPFSPFNMLKKREIPSPLVSSLLINLLQTSENCCTLSLEIEAHKHEPITENLLK